MLPDDLTFSPARILALCVGLAFSLISVSAAVHIQEVNPPNPALPRQYEPGSTATFASLDPHADGVTFQWTHNDVPIPGATASTLTLGPLSAHHSGNYRLIVTTHGIAETSVETLPLNVLPFPASAVDPSFVSDLISIQTARVIGFTSDGDIVVETKLDSSTRQIALLDYTGTTRHAFAVDNSVGATLAAFPDGGVITAAAPYRLQSDGSAGALTLPAEFDATQPLSAAATLPDGKFYLAQQSALARFNADGSVDPAFTFPQYPFALVIQSLRPDATGRLYVNVVITINSPGSSPLSELQCWLLAPTGEREQLFFPPTSLGANGQHGTMIMQPLADGRIASYYVYHGYRSFSVRKPDGTLSWSKTDSFPDALPVIDPVGNAVYFADNRGFIQRYNITASDLVLDPSFNPGTSTAISLNLAVDPDGHLLVSGAFSEWDDHPSPHLARLRTDVPGHHLPPKVTLQPDPTAIPGQPFQIISTVTGTGPFSYQWLPLDGQPTPANPFSRDLLISSLASEHIGRYQLRVTGAAGSILSEVVEVRTSRAPRLSALSARAVAGSGEDTVIAGATISGSGQLGTPVLVRGAGPALRPLGVSDVLPDPILSAFQKSSLLGANDNWSATPQLLTHASRVGAFSFEEGSKDAALFLSLGDGNATFHVSPADSTPGVALLEIYRVPADDPYYEPLGELLNLAFRARTAPGEDTAIAGFVIDDPAGFGRGLRVVLRAVGPTLSNAGVTGALADPILTVFNQKGEIVAQNNDWSVDNTTDAESLAALMKQLGLSELPAGSKDAALALDLPPGVYTMHATGGTGIVLLEIYTAP